MLFSQAKCTHGGQSWELFQANSKQSLELSLASGRESYLLPRNSQWKRHRHI